MIDKALEIAYNAHKGQKDKMGFPYILHPIAVSFMVDSTAEKVVALLHDVVEDTAVTIDDLELEFPAYITDAVRALTNTYESYDDYITNLSQNPLAVRVKLADLRHNMNISRLPDITEKDIIRLNKYKKTYEKLYRH